MTTLEAKAWFRNYRIFQEIPHNILNRFERMYFSDPYHGRDWDEPLINPPHGYWIGDDVSFEK